MSALPRPARRTRRIRGHVAVVLTVGGLVSLGTGCDRAASEDPSPADDSPQPGADTYAAAIASFVDVPAEPPDEPPDPLPIVYVVPIGEPMGIQDQATVIDTFNASHDIRFVDELAAAVDADVPERPPRDEAIVLGLGTIDLQPPHLLRIERYHAAGDIEASLLTLSYLVDHWVVTTAEPVPAEALTDVE